MREVAGLRVVDGARLPEALRRVLKPDALIVDEAGRGRRLPRFFYEVDSRLTADETQLAPWFRLSELLETDVREAPQLQGFPRYVPCAVTLVAAALSVFRERVGTRVQVAVNGGYRSPAHELSHAASTHNWGTAANIYRVGDDLLDAQERIDKYATLARQVLPQVWARPWGHTAGFADDHLHLDLGYVTVVPRDAVGEERPGEGAP
ncbi:MAG TPA: hypothetical protein VMT16_16320 [Thermoanaerobaculia bacterium]|nr:hypothetical protein [Thermoanaerobaculia bacterium]